MIVSLWYIAAISSISFPTGSSMVALDFLPRPLRPVHDGSPLVIGYSHNPRGDNVRRALQGGVNVICWSFFHLDTTSSSSSYDDDDDNNNNNTPMIRTDLDLAAIRDLRNSDQYANVLHMAAIGGWNAPHPPSGISGQTWAETFAQFNQQEGYLFDGIDWDLEGHDDRSATTAQFTIETLNVMADMSKVLKGNYGYLISMAPAESYLAAANDDDDASSFCLQLNVFPEHWQEQDRHIVRQANFSHAGQQCYAYVLHRAGVDTFDWISIQLYESFSRFVYETTVLAERQGILDSIAQAQMEALQRRAFAYTNGFQVELPPHYGTVRLTIPPLKLVFGFANGWADGIKVSCVDSQLFDLVFASSSDSKLNIGGVMFWTIDEEGNNGIYLVDWIQNALLQGGYANKTNSANAGNDVKQKQGDPTGEL